MITDIPSAAAFREAGRAFLNFAWESALELATTFDEAATSPDWASDKEFTDLYWSASQRQLASCTTHAQQGAEFLLKGTIAEVSPFLLLADTPARWPKANQKNEVSYADLRTIDATELVRATNTVRRDPLPDSFVEHFETLRKLRNAASHTIDPRKQYTVGDVIEWILNTSHYLIGEMQWPACRREYLYNHWTTAIDAADGISGVMLSEFECVVARLSKSQCYKYLGHDKKRRSYFCYDCIYGCDWYDGRFKSAQLVRSDSGVDELKCFLCGDCGEFKKSVCSEPDCKGNLANKEDGVCLSCLC